MSEENKNIENNDEERSSESVKPFELLSDSAETEPPIQKKPRSVSLSTFICSAIALVLAATMLTYTVCNGIFQKKLAEDKITGALIGSLTPDGKYDSLEMLEWFFKNYSFEDIDDQKQMNAVMKAFVAATGDKYAEFFTEAEYNEFMSSIAGESVGIGVSVTNDFITINGAEYNTIKIVNIFKGSPAASSDLKVGDRIAWLGTGDDAIYVGDVGYTAAVNMLRGEVGTDAEFIIIRDTGDGEYLIAEMNIARAKYEVESVRSKRLDGTDIGYVAIEAFDIATPKQLSETMDELIEDGCRRFVYDLRNNLGGEISSIVAALSFFLESGDTVITLEEVNGAKRTVKVAALDYTGTDHEACTVTEADIGKYAEFEKVVICNESTVSAAELFVANFRDHKLGSVVGVTTYGKGVAQNTVSLDQFGIDGYLKYTSKIYYPPCGENYNEIGITPDVIVDLSDEAKRYSLYALPLEMDDQLLAAIECLN